MKALEQIEAMCIEIEDEIFICGSFVSDGLKAKTLELLRFISTAPIEIRKVVEEKLHCIVEHSHLYTKVWLYSVIITLTYDPKLMEEFLRYIIQEDEFTLNIKYFLYYRIKSAVFRHIQMENASVKLLKWRLLEQIVKGFRRELNHVIDPIPYEQRKHDLVFVITEQILGEMHAPTKISFDRCKILMEHMHKKVLLINTAEMMTDIGAVPYYDTIHANYSHQLTKKEFVEWKGTSIPYFQCEKNMPNLEVLRMLLQMVRSQKPGMVISIGGSSILSNLIDEMIPVLTVGLGPSDLEMTMTRCQTLSRELAPEDIMLLQQMGKEDSVIQSIFTSSLQPQTTKVTRKELGLPEDRFLLVIVGYRLDVDIDDRFMEMLANALVEGMEIAVIGQFSSCQDYMSKIPGLNGKVHCLGLTDDILAWIEVCDLYVNPYRKGGGTSGVEALFQGIPVVTMPYGDVAVNVGKRFWTESYDTMSDLIKKYKSDPEFYHRMSVLAKERAEILLDTASEFQRIIHEFEKRTRG